MKDETKNNLSPMENEIGIILFRFKEMLKDYSGEPLILEVSESMVIKAALEEYISNMGVK